jgi:hypothetical protein
VRWSVYAGSRGKCSLAATYMCKNVDVDKMDEKRLWPR